MAIQITFYRISEKKPKHNDEIVWLKPTRSFGYHGFEPREITVKYGWTEVDEDGEITGNQCCYSEEDGEDLEGHKLVILFSWYTADDNDLWCSIDDYWACIDNEITLEQ